MKKLKSKTKPYNEPASKPLLYHSNHPSINSCKKSESIEPSFFSSSSSFFEIFSSTSFPFKLEHQNRQLALI